MSGSGMFMSGVKGVCLISDGRDVICPSLGGSDWFCSDCLVMMRRVMMCSLGRAGQFALDIYGY
jgi:hypothetical protein